MLSSTQAQAPIQTPVISPEIAQPEKITLGNQETGTVSNVPTDHVWQWREGIMGEGEKPEWFDSKKYKTIEEQAKGYSEAQKAIGQLKQKLGTFSSGAPENYDFSKVIEGVNVDTNSQSFQQFTQFLKENNVPQNFAEKIVGFYKDEISKNKIDKDAELKKIGVDANEQLQRLSSWVQSNFDPSVASWITKNTQTAEDVTALKALRNSMIQASVPVQGVTPTSMNTKESLIKYMQENMYKGENLSNNPAKQAEFLKRISECV